MLVPLLYVILPARDKVTLDMAINRFDSCTYPIDTHLLEGAVRGGHFIFLNCKRKVIDPVIFFLLGLLGEHFSHKYVKFF